MLQFGTSDLQIWQSANLTQTCVVNFCGEIVRNSVSDRQKFVNSHGVGHAQQRGGEPQ